ncbi:eba9ef49-4644-4506-b792-b6825da796ee [Sclerotinia trifoliorum]|uniref:Eba9ef49-4644-4506-b792-b6825da796ee n=1 Tax=Sclerotinia trifoliorum TaxID=28548 RepID=A0A8H2VRA2_9HELO|nr:eba9ef49-4644-4506-b792-b6825da796ee [Sclerotinia trifoliorum]
MARITASPTTSVSRYSHPSAEPPPLAFRPRQQEVSRLEGKLQRAKIILGFSAIGKTHLAAKANREFEWLHVIDFSLIPQGLDFTNDYKADYLQTIADAAGQPGVLLLGGPRWVGEFLVASDLTFSSVYPTDDCREEYRMRWDQMGEEEGLIAHRLTWWDDSIAAMQWPSGRCNHFELYPGVYLEDIFMNILTVADQVEGLDEESSPEDASNEVWHDAHEALQLPSGRKRSQTQSDAIKQVIASINSSWSSRIRAFLNYIFLILQFIFLSTLATLIMLAYREWNVWQSRNRPDIPTIGEFSSLSRIHDTVNRWFLPQCLSSILPNSRETWLGASAFRKELVVLVRKWLDLEELLLKA